MRSIVCAVSVLLLTALTASGCSGPGAASAGIVDDIFSSIAFTETEEIHSAEEPAFGGFDLKSVLNPQGDIYRIVCHGDSFEQMFSQFYPGYRSGEKISEELRSRVSVQTGRLGDVQIIWTVFNGDDDSYESFLDQLLNEQNDVPEADRIDLFLIRTDQLYKYCGAENEVALTMDDLGITEQELSSQYSCLREISSGEDSLQRAVTFDLPVYSWYCRVHIAEEVLGTSDPETLADSVGTWEKFRQTSALMKESGFSMYSSFTELYEPCISDVTVGWVDRENSIIFDERIVDWIHTTKADVEAGICAGTERFSKLWEQELSERGGNTFGYFLTFAEASEYLSDSPDDWECVEGPATYPGDALWLCAAAGSDNKDLSAEIIRFFSTDRDTLREIHEITGFPVNHRDIMGSSAAEPDLILHREAENCSLLYRTVYDRRLGQFLREAYLPYFRGETEEASALSRFYALSQEEYPDLLG